jgi:hypothetical protein
MFLCFVWISEQRLFPGTTLTEWVLGEFAKLRKAAFGFVPSARMEQLSSHLAGFHEI